VDRRIEPVGRRTQPVAATGEPVAGTTELGAEENERVERSTRSFPFRSVALRPFAC
jgi:hypothetical protein